MTTPVLQVRDLSSGYGATRVVRSVSLDVAAGEVVVLVGRNGMGKSTLLRTIMGYNRLQGGQVLLCGTDMSAAAVHRRVRAGMAYVPQERALFQDLSIRDNLRLGVSRDQAFASALDRVRSLFPFLADRLHQPAGTLSGGEQKMLLVARALMTNAPLVLIDEVTEGLQPSVVDRLAHIVRDAARCDGRAILLVEQHIPFAMSVGDRCAALRLGEIAVIGAVGDSAIQLALEEQLRV